jgi:4-amino-4-deoxy-L-arabinose transferase-like glycosyltransferase
MENQQNESQPTARWLDIAVWIAVLALACLRFVHLDYGDLKDYDECLYAWRAKLICYGDAWIDQTDFSFRGFWSGSFPPLTIWVMAVCFQLFGFGEFVARFGSALSGVGTVILLFLMGRRLNRDRWSGLFAALFLASTWYFTVYSRRCQMDVPSVFLITLSLYGYVGYLDRLRIAGPRRLEANGRTWPWLVLSGLALGLGLMTKIAMAFMAAVIVGGVALYAWVRGRHSFGRIVLEQIVINGVALLVCLPWHLAMILSPKGDVFVRWYFGYHLLQRTTATLGHDAGPWHFYIPYLTGEISPPVLGLALVAILWSIVVLARSFRNAQETPDGGWTETERYRPWFHADLRYVLPLLWLGLQFVFFSTAETKRDTYSIPMYPPIALLAGLFLGERLYDRRRLRLLAVTLFSVSLFCVLSRMKELGRLLAYSIANREQIHLYGDVYVRLGLLIAGIAVAVFVAYRLLRRRGAIFCGVALLTTVSASAIFCLRAMRPNLDPDRGTRTLGWQQIRPVLDRMDYHYLVFVGNYTDPEAIYYFNGLQYNWHPYTVFVNMPWYDDNLLALYASSDDVRVVTFWTWLESHWTDEQRDRLFERLELITHSGLELAVYRPKRR